jgi:hypothetical protein
MNGEDVIQPVNDNKPIITVKREGSTSNEWKVECRIPMRPVAKPSLPPSCRRILKVSGLDVSHGRKNMCSRWRTASEILCFVWHITNMDSVVVLYSFVGPISY